MFRAAMLSKTSFIEEDVKCLLRELVNAGHSIRMILTVSGQWQAEHSGDQCPITNNYESIGCGRCEVGGDFNAVTVRKRPSFAAESAFSFPGMPTWLGIQHKAMVFPCFVWTEYSLINFCTRSLSMLKAAIACRLDTESEKITNFFQVWLANSIDCQKQSI